MVGVLIDLGCGNGHKLGHIVKDLNVKVVAVDYHASLATARENLTSAEFIECNFADWSDTEKVATALSSNEVTVVILSDVIEHVIDPRPLLVLLRSIIAENEQSRLVISTPDRSKLFPIDHNSLPKNSSHVREWTLVELCGLLNCSGLRVETAGHAHPNQFDDVASTSVAVARYDAGFHYAQLAKLGLDLVRGETHALITSEFPGLNKSGGIGAFVASQAKRVPNSFVLLIERPSCTDVARQRNVIWPELLLSEAEVRHLPREDQALECMFQLMLVIPGLRTVHFQDYGGIGCRISQARRVNLLPASISAVVHCHGNTFYLENANEEWSRVSNAYIPQKEKIAVEAADLVVFPTEFLRQLYRESGVSPSSKRVLIEPYCYERKIVNSAKRSPIKRVAFVGKRSHMKGFDIFIDAFTADTCDQVNAPNVTELVFIGPDVPGFNPRSQIESLKDRYTVQEYKNFDWFEMCEYIRSNAGDTLFVLPYRADNFPLAIVDVVANGGLMVALESGGVPEMFSGDIWKRCLCKGDKKAVAAKISEFCRINPSEAQFVVGELTTQLDARQDLEIPYTSHRLRDEHVSKISDTATVLIPFYNTEISYVEALIDGLNSQSVSPAEVIIVDDASTVESHAALQRVCAEKLVHPFRIVRHSQNLGLAGARNTALRECKTEFLLNIDSDDVPLNEWIRDIVKALEANPSAVAAVPYLTAFSDGRDFHRCDAMEAYTYRPLGEGTIIAQTDNVLGHANSGVRVPLAQELGGWGAHVKAKYEDWAFYLGAVSNGYGIVIIPRTGCLYRVRPKSMVRTYADWEGYRRISTVTSGLSRFEAVSLQRHLRSAKAVLESLEARSANGAVQSAAASAAQSAELERLKSRRVLIIADGMKRRLQRHPLLWAVTIKAYQATWAVSRFVLGATRR